MFRSLRGISFVSVVLFLGCKSCDSGSSVPSAVNSPPAPSAQPAPTVAPSVIAQTPDVPAMSSYFLMPNLGEPGRNASIAGVPLTLAGVTQGELLVRDFDHDGDPDALVLGLQPATETSEAHAELYYVPRNRAEQGTPRSLGTLFRAPAGDFVSELHLVGDDLVMIVASCFDDCDLGHEDADGAPNASSLTLVATDNPRIVLQALTGDALEFGYQRKIEGLAGQRTFTINLRGEPVDDKLELVWREIDGQFRLKSTIDKLVAPLRRRAAHDLARAPETASALTSAAAFWESTLCDEFEHTAQIVVDGHLGIGCSRSRAWLARCHELVAGEALASDPAAALSKIAVMGCKPDAEEQARLDQAILDITIPASQYAVVATELNMPPPDSVTDMTPRIAVDDDGVVALRTSNSSWTGWSIPDAHPVEAPALFAQLARSADDTRELVDVRMSCSGSAYVLIGQSDSTGPPRSYPIDEPAVQCTPDTRRLRSAANGGMDVLGWTADGRVALGSYARVDYVSFGVRGDGTASAAAAPNDVGSLQRNAPVRGYQTTADGKTFVLSAPAGALLVRSESKRLLRPEAWASSTRVEATAISPGGRYVAALVAGRAWVIDLQPAPPAP